MDLLKFDILIIDPVIIFLYDISIYHSNEALYNNS